VSRLRKNIQLCCLILAFNILLPAWAATGEMAAPGPTATLTLNNRSNYQMFSSIWTDAYECTNRMAFAPPLDINQTEKSIQVPAGNPIAVGVAIFQMQDKLPVVCDLIYSFALKPDSHYSLVYDVHDRRCYGELFRQEGGRQKLLTDMDPEGVVERFPEFGWDQFEPGCMAE
jgi:hypothetical protein